MCTIPEFEATFDYSLHLSILHFSFPFVIIASTEVWFLWSILCCISLLHNAVYAIFSSSQSLEWKMYVRSANTSHILAYELIIFRSSHNGTCAHNLAFRMINHETHFTLELENPWVVMLTSQYQPESIYIAVYCRWCWCSGGGGSGSCCLLFQVQLNDRELMWFSLEHVLCCCYLLPLGIDCERIWRHDTVHNRMQTHYLFALQDAFGIIESQVKLSFVRWRCLHHSLHSFIFNFIVFITAFQFIRWFFGRLTIFLCVQLFFRIWYSNNTIEFWLKRKKRVETTFCFFEL